MKTKSRHAVKHDGSLLRLVDLAIIQGGLRPELRHSLTLLINVHHNYMVMTR
jgi:hypothetical protein